MDKQYHLKGSLTNDCTGVIFEHATMVAGVISHLSDTDLCITIEPLRTKRTDKQNRYLHGVIVTCIRYWFKTTKGKTITVAEAKAYIYNVLLGHKFEIIELEGREVFITRGKHFSDMNTKEFNEAKEMVQLKMAEKGCDIPDPRENNLLTDFVNA